MDPHKIVIYHHPNPELRSFLTMIEISTHRVEHFKKPLSSESKDVLKKLGVIGAGIVKDVLNTPGIKELHIKPKELIVKKEADCTWEEIEGKVIKILNHSFRRKEIRVVHTKN
ncbi:MAG: NifU N-terminal domain-containing protein [Deltaproteobacteria bacterium]|nr:NifU N-terminal domain-containing protein [Deltaproteobacteria bacterium]